MLCLKGIAQDPIPDTFEVVPRICALAEVAWRPAELRNADEFLQRIKAEYPWFKQMNINFRHEDGSPAAPESMPR